jgi:hypothetical protein
VERERFVWKVKLQANDGSMHEETIKNFWSPEQPDIKHQIGVAAAAKRWYLNGKKVEFVPISVERVHAA